MFDIQEFTSNIQGRGVARTNRYELRLPNNKIIGSSDEVSQINIRCAEVSIPELEINVQSQFISGMVRKTPTHRQYRDFTATIIASENLSEYTIFQRWISRVVHPTTGIVSWMKNYVVDVDLFQLDQNNKSVSGVRFKNAFPMSLGSISYAQQADEIVRFSVTITYQTYSLIDNLNET